METILIDYGYLSLFLLSFLAATVVPVGSEWLLVALLLNGHSPVCTVIVATIGNTLGACTTYAIGLYGGSCLTGKVLRISPEAIQRAERRYARYGSWSLLFSWVPIIGDPFCLVSGILKTPFILFFILVLIGKLARYAFVAAVTVWVQ
jgi:membrane protein YqaA with SNARE-associated domain